MWESLFRSLASAVHSSPTCDVIVSMHGRIEIIGLIGNRLIQEVGQQEIRNAFAKIEMREAHNSHFISRLIERGPAFDITTLNEMARAINYGVARAGTQPGTIEIVFSNGRVAAIANESGEFITFKPL